MPLDLFRRYLSISAVIPLVILSTCSQNKANDGGGVSGTSVVFAAAPQTTITIASFNVLHLGWDNGKDLDALAKVLVNYDVIGLLEVMNTEILDSVEIGVENLSGTDWGYIVSSNKIGRSNYKEYYAFIYRKDRTTFLEGTAKLWNDEGDKFEREPFYASFKSGNFDYTLILMHSDFDNNKEVMRKEARELAVVYKALHDADPSENDLILMGDFNLKASDVGWADLKALSTVINLIPHTTRTTVSTTGNLVSPYDNIWLQTQYTAYEFADRAEASYSFAQFFGFVSNPVVAWRERLSDHVPVFAVFHVNKTDDD